MLSWGGCRGFLGAARIRVKAKGVFSRDYKSIK